MAFVQSDQWWVAGLLGFNILLFWLLGLMVKQRLDKLEGLLSKCQESHQQCEAWKTNALTAIAILHTTLARYDNTLPRLSDLLGPDAMSAMIHASEFENAAHNRQKK